MGLGDGGDGIPERRDTLGGGISALYQFGFPQQVTGMPKSKGVSKVNRNVCSWGNPGGRRKSQWGGRTPEKQVMGNSDLAKEPNISLALPESSVQPDDAEG